MQNWLESWSTLHSVNGNRRQIVNITNLDYWCLELLQWFICPSSQNQVLDFGKPHMQLLG